MCPLGAYHALYPRFAQVGYFEPGVPAGQGNRINHCVPTDRTAQILPQSKNLDNERKQIMFHIENARLLSVFYLNLLFLPCGHMLPGWWVVFRVVTQQLRGSVSTLGSARHLFFTIAHPCLLFAPPHQTICSQEARGDVATSDLIPFCWGPLRRQG